MGSSAPPTVPEKLSEGPKMAGLGRTVQDDATQIILYIWFGPLEVFMFLHLSTGGFYVLGYFATKMFMFSSSWSFYLHFVIRGGRGRTRKGR